MNIDLEVLIAVITAISALIISIYNSIVTFQSQKRLELLKHKFEEEKAEKNARRDYEYEAKKRLYQEYEPYYFIFTELAKSAMSRIEGLSKTISEGKFKNEKWMKLKSYYFRTTVYSLFAPFAIIKLIHDKLTVNDFSIENRIYIHYALFQILYNSYRDDFKLARISEVESIKEYVDYWREKIIESPEGFSDRQGLTPKVVDSFIDTFLIKNGNEFQIINFDSFEKKILSIMGDKHSSDENFFRLSKQIEVLFENFNPNSNSNIIWRILIVQACIYFILLKTRFEVNLTKTRIEELIDLFFQSERENFTANLSDPDLVNDTFRCSKRYLLRQLEKQLEGF